MSDHDEQHQIAQAVASLGDQIASARLLKQALKFDPDPDYRRELRREFRDLTDTQSKEQAA